MASDPKRYPFCRFISPLCGSVNCSALHHIPPRDIQPASRTSPLSHQLMIKAHFHPFTGCPIADVFVTHKVSLCESTMLEPAGSTCVPQSIVIESDQCSGFQTVLQRYSSDKLGSRVQGAHNVFSLAQCWSLSWQSLPTMGHAPASVYLRRLTSHHTIAASIDTMGPPLGQTCCNHAQAFLNRVNIRKFTDRCARVSDWPMQSQC